MKSLGLTSICLLGGVAQAFAQSTSTSASYTLLHGLAGDHSGGSVSVGSVAANISVGDPAFGSVSNVSATGVQAKGNYIGQLYDPVSVDLSAAPATVTEGAARQLTVNAEMDDATTLALDPAEVSFGYSTPISDVDAVTGIATAGVVYEDTVAPISAMYSGLEDTFGLTVLNVDVDDYLDYAGDGIDDAWQFSHFGAPPNADAAPTANPDGDSQNNEFEWLTGYSPTDATEFFRFEMIGRSGSTNTLMLSKVVPGAQYAVQRSLDLGEEASWVTFVTLNPVSEVLDETVADTGASQERWFYRVDVSPE